MAIKTSNKHVIAITTLTILAIFLFIVLTVLPFADITAHDSKHRPDTGDMVWEYPNPLDRGIWSFLKKGHGKAAATNPVVDLEGDEEQLT